jgi:tetratricopeptide (TPR) repeat protein
MSGRITALAGLPVLVATLSMTSLTVAQPAATKVDAGKAAKAPAAKSADGVRRDPRGVTGISPFWEAIAEGDRAYVAGSYDDAVTSYKKAIAADPNNPMGHYRVGQAHVANSQIPEAEKAYQAALRYAASDPQLKAKILFVLADLKERQHDSEGAVAGWNAYADHTKANANSGYPATAGERKKVNAKWQELQQQYAEVKARIAKRQAEADEQLKKSSK